MLQRRFVRVDLVLLEHPQTSSDPVLVDVDRVIAQFRSALQPVIVEVIHEAVMQAQVFRVPQEGKVVVIGEFTKGKLDVLVERLIVPQHDLIGRRAAVLHVRSPGPRRSQSPKRRMRHAQFLAPTLNGVAGGATETVTNAATVFIDQAPSGSNIAIATTAELMFGESTDNTAMIKVQNETSSNTSGRGLNISGANGLGSGQGGTVQIDAGRGGATGIGGSVNLIAGNGGTTSGAGGTVALSSGSGGTGGLGSAGSIILETGDGTGVSNRDGGDIFLQTGNGVSGGSNGTVFILYDSPTTALAEESVLLWVNNSESVGLANGTTLANNRFTIFDSQTINGIAGGDTETITNAATLYIEDAPSGSNITFTNGPYALWVDDGQTRLDGTTTVSGIVVQDTLTATATGALGWSVQTGANTACNTTCTNACVFGQDTDTANGPIVDCTDASADRCTCAGVN